MHSFFIAFNQIKSPYSIFDCLVAIASLYNKEEIMMKKSFIKPSILPGFMELLPKEQRIFDDIASKILDVYERNGCFPIDTPVIEKSEVLLVKSGGETEKQVYAFQKGKNNLALRFDLTVPFARYVAQHLNELEFPFKRYQLGKVYRGERNQRGRYREFYQLDIDVINKEKLSVDNDAWVISLASQAFKEINLPEYKFQISNRKILSGVFDYLNIENSLQVMNLIDKYDKVMPDEFNKELIDLIGQEKSEYITKIMSIAGSSNEIVNELKKLDINDIYMEGVEELARVIKILDILKVTEEEYDINLKIIRGLDYYTGTVFETKLIGYENYGSICSGGRYDNLAENYTTTILPGVGISIGLTRLFFVLQEIGFIDNYNLSTENDYLIIPVGDTIDYCCMILDKLLKKGYRASIYFEEASLKKKMKYADNLGIQNVILVGEDEVINKKVKIKNMASGKEVELEM